MVLILAKILLLVSVASCHWDNFELLITQQQVTDYYIKYQALPYLFNLTACAWFRTTSQATELTIISYAVPDFYNNIWMGLQDPGLSWYIGSEFQKAYVENDLIRDGNWHHMCSTWDDNGNWTIYLNGNNIASDLAGPLRLGPLSPGHEISDGGTLVIGQDQDTCGGEFESHQSFVGALTGVNLYDRTLSSDEILRVSEDCNRNDGNVFKWSDVRGGLRGQIQVLPSSCDI